MRQDATVRASTAQPGRDQREPGVSGTPAGGLGGDHTGGGNAVAGDEPIVPDDEDDGKPADGALDDGAIDVPGVVPGRVRLVGSPVVGSTGDVVPNGCGVTNGDGAPVGDCAGSVEGEDDGGTVCGVVLPVWASAGAAARATITSARIARDITRRLL
jgi:hypothetical protein